MRPLCAALVTLLAALPGRAGEPRTSTVCEHTDQQAGYARCMACYAKPGRTDKDDVGYVGGGCLGWKGEARSCDEGTFGWDYVGCRKYGHVFLDWCHCRKQPAPGPYKIDGPRVPDVFSVHPLRTRLAEKHHCPDGD